MEERPPPRAKPVLQKPPGYRDPAAPAPAPPRPPVRKQPLPPSFRGINAKHGRHRSRRPCFCWFCCWLFILLVVLFFAIAIAGAPSFHFESIQNPKFNVTAKPDGSFLDATTVVRIQIANPNRKISVTFSPTEASVTVPGDGDSGDSSLGSGTFPAFDLGKKNSTVIRLEARVQGAAVDEVQGKRLSSQFRSKSLRVMVELQTRLRILHGGKKSGTVPVKVLCGGDGGLTLKQLEGGASPKCTINLFKWINLP
ncbi:unnamed protein product [Spirodela intermedia]|uniref:Late embryogenesis abundant protein LEA-2 subgroup domain-containing protein n=1 Tax=Spirodela intermedia TaxID=51605 RepID=A0A7I8IT27_SPIIN|nr:unnamed protein product [Spirodela intermedia]CAA6661034.1 unnamed protein product [Spirodela intermedia]